MPVSRDAKRDRDIFLKIMTMDEAGLRQRKSKPIDQETLETLLTENEIRSWLRDENGDPKPRWGAGLTSEEKDLVQRLAFDRLAYDEKLDYCLRPEQIDGPSAEAWADINAHLGTTASALPELVQQLGIRRFGHIPRVGDPECGGGSIPFEAARLGCAAYASDLSPVAALLTWGALHLVGGDAKTRQRVREIQQTAYEATLKEIDAHGLETNDKGWRHEQLYYVVEAKSPATGLWVPLATAWVISEKYRVCAVIKKNAAKGKQQLDSMTTLDDESEPNFGDTDYQLAAYAAALRVLTQFADIEGMDIRHELFRERTRSEKSEFEKVIDRAVEIAANHLIPRGFDEFHWKSLGSDERLYLKGLELERHREARAGAYIELAKGFGVREYTNLYERSEANAVRFKTASEFKRQQLEGEGFASSLTCHVLFAIAETVREENARAGLDYLKTDGAVDYWGKRKAILALLAYFKPLAHIGHMPHWGEDADGAERLAGAVENDH